MTASIPPMEPPGEPSLDELKQLVLRKRLERAMRESPSFENRILRVDRERLPLSWPQQRLWILEQIDPSAGASYHVSAALRMRGKLHVTALRAALDGLVARHEMLRTHFVATEEGAIQVVDSEHTRMPLREHDLRMLDPDEREEAMYEIAIATASFDLEHGPLIRCRLLRLGDEDHLLVIVQHHIVTDGWSIGILLSEFNALYGAFVRGADNPLPALPVQYGDYAVWQRREVDGEALAEQLVYWRAQLEGAPQLLMLPLDRPRPSRQSFSGASVPIHFSPELTRRVRAFAARYEVTVFNVILMAWSVLLARLSGQQDIVVGISVANRQRRELEHLVGFFVNTLAIRVSLSDDLDVDTAITRTRTKLLDAYARQSVPFERVVEAVCPERTMSHSPIFQAMFTYDNTPAGSVDLPGLTLEAVSLPQETTHFDITLALSEGDDRIGGRLEYVRDLFDASTVERWGRHLCKCLESLVAANGADAVASLDVLDRVDRECLNCFSTGARKVYPEEALIHRLFEAQAARTPLAIAAEFEGATLDYAELDARANQLAHYLREHGCGPDTLVAIAAERSLEMIVALLGVLKSGAAFLPLDPAYPADRLAYMLEDAKPLVLLTQAHLDVGRPDRGGRHMLCIDSDWSDVAAHPSTPFDSGVQPDHLAYVIYTSGSTGRPKGVMVHHRGISNHMCWLRENHPMGVDDVLVQKTPFSFDACIWDFFSALICGARLLIAKPGHHFDVEYLIDLIIEGKATRLKLVPTLLRALLENPRFAQCTSLCEVFSGGEALAYNLSQRFFEVLPDVVLYNHWGATENCVNITYYPCVPGDMSGRVPIGSPIANTTLYIVDERLNPVPIGAPGEVLVGGIQVGRGYLNRPELTDERFIRDPFSSDPDARLYRTGDLCRWLDDGNVEYIGRGDFQVKIRGFRIELGEVEAQLLACDAVKDAVVITREEQSGDPRLVAYVVVEGSVIDADALREHLAGVLPEYMVPAAIVFLAALPWMPNGKIDRKGLPAPDRTAFASRRYEAPTTPTERQVAEVWSTLLGIERISRHDNFFELGGHSMLAVRLIAQLKKRGIHADVRGVFTTNALQLFCKDIDERVVAVQSPVPANRIPNDVTILRPDMLPLVELTREEIDSIVAQVRGGAANIQDIYPLASLQEGILFRHLMEDVGDLYLSRTAVGFASRQHLDRFLSALRKVVARHDILRTSIHWQGLRQPVQVVHRSVDLPVTEHAIPSNVDILSRLLDIADPTSMRIELDRAPLLAVHIAEEPGLEAWKLVLVRHHIVSDHVTLELIVREIRILLEQGEEALPKPLPYRDHIAHMSTTSNEAHEDHFRRLLGDVDEPTVPFEVYALNGGADRVREASVRIPSSLSAAIRFQAQARGIIPAALFHVGWAQVVARCSGRDDVVFGTVLSGRLQGGDQSDATMGVFINTLPFRLRLGETPVELAVAAANTQLGELFAHEQASLALAQRCSSVAAPTPLFTCLLNYRHSSTIDDAGCVVHEWQGIEILHLEERTDYPLSMSVNDEGELFSFAVHCAHEIDPNRLLGYFETAMRGLVERLASAPDAQMRIIGILPQAERDQILRTFNAMDDSDAMAVAYPRESTLAEVFAQVVDRTPAAPALRWRGGALSYAQLDAASERLARRLRGHGAAAGARIALCSERSAALIVAMLAVVKTGAAYVPMDPDYPSERLRFMLEDSAPVAVLAPSVLASRLEGGGAVLLPLEEVLDDFDAVLRADTDMDIHADTRMSLPEDLAYVIYTSGSTGQPKGVAIEQRQVLHLTTVDRDVRIAPGDRVAHCANPAFDAATWEIWSTLLRGATLVIVDGETLLDPAALEAQLRAERVNILHLTVGLFNRYADTLAGVYAQLDCLLFGGERCDPMIVSKVARNGGGARLVHCYGPTETTTFATMHEVARGIDPGRRVPIGRPITNARVYILDGHGEPVPVGVTGELYVGGAGVGRGYAGRPEWTAERFVADPYASAPQARMYRTGDLGRWLPDGTIEYLGRNDYQVKVRGYRIELGEIEAKLSDHPAIESARVLLRTFDDGESQMVAYVIPSLSAAAVVRRLLRMESVQSSLPPALDAPNIGTVFHRNRDEVIALNEALFPQGHDSYFRHGLALEEHDCVFDVGANIGWFSLQAHGRCAGIRLFAFEPIEPVCEMLRQNFVLHGVEAEVFDCGLSRTEGEADFAYYPDNTWASHHASDIDWIQSASLTNTHDREHEVHRRPLRTVSAIIHERVVERIDLLKVDVAGAEHDVLLGIDEAHWPKIRQVVIEVADIGQRLVTISSLLRAHGFDLVCEKGVAYRGRQTTRVYARRHDVPAPSPVEPAGDAWCSRRALLDDVRAHMASALPAFMQPMHYILMDAMPLTPNGKLDEHALPMPARADIPLDVYEAPIGEVETTITEIWIELLHLDGLNVGRNDAFFALGGHSLLAVQLSQRVRERLGVPLAIRDIFRRPTLRAMAEVVVACQLKQFDQADVSAATEGLEQLSEAELQALLEATSG